MKHYHSFSKPNVCSTRFAHETLPGCKYKIKSQHLGILLKIFGLELKVLQMKTTYVSKFFISSMFTSDNQCPKIQYFGQLTYTFKTMASYNASSCSERTENE